MAVDPVSQRFNMSQTQFNGLSRADQERVITARIVDQAIKPALDRATSRMKEANADRSKALKGES